MEIRIFYSWQSDSPKATNRSFIEDALENAVKDIRKTESLKVEPVVDRDTLNVPGSPDIRETILNKIENSHVFVGDVTSTFQRDKKLSPNPNVLVELGYAMKVFKSDRILMVLNTAFGSIDDLPFDLRGKLVIHYHMEQSNSDRASERKNLTSKFKSALITILRALEVEAIAAEVQPQISITDSAIEAIKQARPEKTNLVKQYMSWMIEELKKLAPDFDKEGEDNILLLTEAISSTKELLIGFCRVAEVVAINNSADEAEEIYKYFENIVELYNVSTNYTGSYRTTDFDFFKFIGHEFFVSFITLLIKENRWQIIGNLLKTQLFIRDGPGYSSDTWAYTIICQPLHSFDNYNREHRTISYHADLLNSRHNDAEIKKYVSAEDFMSADLLLQIRSKILEEKLNYVFEWYAFSKLYLRELPKFLVETKTIKGAEKVMHVLGLESVEELRQKFNEVKPKLADHYYHRNLYYALNQFDVSQIGTK